jgi:hypothetical protein
MMKKLFPAVFLVLLTVTLQAQQEQSYLLTNVHHQWGPSMVQFKDPYLSILDYQGIGMRLVANYSRFFNAENNRLSHTSRFSGMGALTVNPESTASVIYMGGTGSWGMQYHLRPGKNLMLTAGGNLEGEFGYRMNSRNVNNPVNFDLATNLNGTFSARYFIHTRKRVMELHASYEFPLMGMMMVLPPGMLFYELSNSGNFASVLHPSGLKNRQGLRQTYRIDIPLSRSTWSFGLRSNMLRYQVNNHIYGMDEVGVFMGITYDNYRFAGRKRPAPANFVSPKY